MRALWSDRPNCSHNVSQKVNLSGAFLKNICDLFFNGFAWGLGIEKRLGFLVNFLAVGFLYGAGAATLIFVTGT